MGRTSFLCALAFVVLGTTTSAPTLAETIERASQKDIPKLLDAATGLNSAYMAMLVGETRDRVYFEYVTGIHPGSSLTNRPKRVVYWLPRSEITAEQLAQFSALKEKYLKAHGSR